MPVGLGLAGLEVTRAFLHRTVRGSRSAVRRRVPISIERVVVTTGVRSSFECRALPRALAVVELPDEVAAVHLEIVAGRGHDRVVLDWRADGSSCGEVTGRNRTWVVGVHGVVQRFLDERGYAAPAPLRHRRPDPSPRHRGVGRWNQRSGVSLTERKPRGS